MQHLVHELSDQAGKKGHSKENALERARQMLDHVLREGMSAERDVVLQARTNGDVTPAAADHVLSEIESRAARIEV